MKSFIELKTSDFAVQLDDKLFEALKDAYLKMRKSAKNLFIAIIMSVLLVGLDAYIDKQISWIQASFFGIYILVTAIIFFINLNKTAKIQKRLGITKEEIKSAMNKS